ncbi:MAG: hypothetical protein ACHQYP_11420 [Nitrospiria bacterium]
MKVPCGKGIANHTGPESCVAYREVRLEALTGEHIGQPLSRESIRIQGADAVGKAEGNMTLHAIASAGTALRGPETLACMDALCVGTGRPPA